MIFANVSSLKIILKIYISSNRSQNDSLKAEILAQDTAYKAQTVALENKAHEAWLTARQSERKVEELRQESTILRRRLTSIAELQPGSSHNSLNHSKLRDFQINTS